MSDNKIMQEFTKKLLYSRMRILNEFGFYGMLLMHMGFVLDSECKTIDTDGKKIYINPDYILNLSAEKLDYMLMHVILHIVLQHLTRRKNFDKDIFDTACDIVVNSNLLESYENSSKSVPFADIYHLCPDNSEGRKHTAEEVYGMLIKIGRAHV